MAHGEWKQVPVDPTPEMIEAGSRVACNLEGKNPDQLFGHVRAWTLFNCISMPVYEAMLAAAPTPAEAVPLTFTYRNWRGEVAERRVIPLGVRFGSTEWHPEPQWLLRGIDIDKQAEREFALKDIGAPPPAGAEAVRRAAEVAREYAAAEYALRDAARKEDDPRDAMVHGYAADYAQAIARDIEALSSQPPATEG